MKIIPIRTGTIYCNKTVLTYGKGFDVFLKIPVTAWYIEKGNTKILVDTGMCDTARAHQYHYKNSTQNNEERIDKALIGKGIQIQDIDIVILTHLHWDHCSNIDLFDHTTCYLQRKELDYANDPIPSYYSSYESPHIGLVPSYNNTKFELLSGEIEILPGVNILPTPGHSPGHQSVIVEGSQTYVIAGDACLCHENLMPDTNKNVEFTMIGRFMDVNETWRSLEKIKSIADFVLPGHEPKVFDQEYYQ